MGFIVTPMMIYRIYLVISISSGGCSIIPMMVASYSDNNQDGWSLQHPYGLVILVLPKAWGFWHSGRWFPGMCRLIHNWLYISPSHPQKILVELWVSLFERTYVTIKWTDDQGWRYTEATTNTWADNQELELLNNSWEMQLPWKQQEWVILLWVNIYHPSKD